MKEQYISHMVKMEDLNHHNVLYAGRACDWLIESAFVAAATTVGNAKAILFLKLDNFEFLKPVYPGEILSFKSKVSSVGTTSLTVDVTATSQITGENHLQGIAKFVSVDEKKKTPTPHNITL